MFAGLMLYGSLAAAKDCTKMKFDKTAVGSIPAGWTVETTNSTGRDAVWKVISDKTAPSGSHVLALTDAKKNHGSTFNLCWSKKISLKDGTLKVEFKARTGNEDQGGGIMWRVRNKKNYYVARFNPLEDNFRLYYVKDGHRRMLATARVRLTAGKWHSMKIVVQGNRFQAFLDGKPRLKVSDDTFKNAGGAGLWTKADAATSFDNFIAHPRSTIKTH